MFYSHHCPGVNKLLINYSNEKVKVQYASNKVPFLLPAISFRPPYYVNPRCEWNYPII